MFASAAFHATSPSLRHVLTVPPAVRPFDGMTTFLCLAGCFSVAGVATAVRRISLRYPAVEALTALLFTACYVWFGPTWLTVKFCTFSFLLVGLLFMDAETGRPATRIYLSRARSGACLFVDCSDRQLGNAILACMPMACSFRPSKLHFLIRRSLLSSAQASFSSLQDFTSSLRKRQGMGTGDFALIAMSGAFLGLKLTLLVVFLAPVLATIYALVADRAPCDGCGKRQRLGRGNAAIVGNSVWRLHQRLFTGSGIFWRKGMALVLGLLLEEESY